MAKFGSLDRPVTITIDGPAQSGKMALAAFLALKLEEFGAITDFTADFANPEMAAKADESWATTKVWAESTPLTFKKKSIHIVVVDK